MPETKWLPWQELMAFGLGHLRLSSKDFWTMSLRELDAAIEGCFGNTDKATPIKRDQLIALMCEHPDD